MYQIITDGSWDMGSERAARFGVEAVSYTHLDVYKRQSTECTDVPICLKPANAPFFDNSVKTDSGRWIFSQCSFAATSANECRIHFL